MGVYSGSIRVRRTQDDSDPESAVECFNTITAAFVGCGMLPVSSGDIPGQAGEFIAEGVAGPDQTLVVVPTASTNKLVGFNDFKHPTLNLFIRVRYMICMHNGVSRFCWVGYRLRYSLDGDMAPVDPLIAEPAAHANYPAKTLAAMPNTYGPLRASCGPDHFWISGDIAVSFTPASAKFGAPFTPSLVGLGVFQSPEGALAVMSPPPVYIGNGAVGFESLTANSSTETQQGRFAVGMPPSEMVVPTYNGALHTMADHRAGMAAGGMRVAQASVMRNGLRHTFNFGWVNGLYAADGIPVEVNLIGLAQTYVTCTGLSHGGHAHWNATDKHVSIPMLPWADGWEP